VHECEETVQHRNAKAQREREHCRHHALLDEGSENEDDESDEGGGIEEDEDKDNEDKGGGGLVGCPNFPCVLLRLQIISSLEANPSPPSLVCCPGSPSPTAPTKCPRWLLATFLTTALK